VQELMRGTPYEQDMRGLLLRIKGADSNNNNPMSFNGSATKVVRVPLSRVTGQQRDLDPF